MSAPHAPWSLVGECVIAVVGRRPRVPLPKGLHVMPGPTAIIALRYSDSPVGAFNELWVAEPARLGLRPGLCATTAVTDSADARAGGIVNWGFPKELGSLRWSFYTEGCALRWEERSIAVRADVSERLLPILVPLRALQRRGDGPVTVPVRLYGRARTARVQLDVPDGDPLARLRGRHRGLHVSGMRLLLDPARIPVGLASTLRAPLGAPEPALTSMGQSRGD